MTLGSRIAVVLFVLAVIALALTGTTTRQFRLSVHAQQAVPTSTPPPSQTKPSAPGPDEDAQDVIRINTNLVQVDAVVTRSGKQVTDLSAEDFEILEDGKPQAITAFSYISNIVPVTDIAAQPIKRTNVPAVSARPKPQDVRRTIAFVVDNLGMSVGSVASARKALRNFLNERMEPNDLIAIVRTSGEVGALQQFTNDRRLLRSAIDQVKWTPCSRGGLQTFDAQLRPCAEFTMGVSLDALKYIVKGMSSLPGRKAMVVMSDVLPLDMSEPETLVNVAARRSPTGATAQPVSIPNIADVSSDSSGSRTSYEQAINRIAELAIRGSVVIYTVDTRGLEITFPTAAEGFKGSHRDIIKQMSQMMSDRSFKLFNDRGGAELMSRQTGGLSIYNSNDFGIKRIYEDQQGYYLIGFRPTETTFNRAFHHITLRVKGKGLKVRTRSGFFGMTDDEARSGLRAISSVVNEALVSPFRTNEITVGLSSLFTNTLTKGSLLRSFIYVNAGELLFKVDTDGFHNASFDVDTILFGNNGRLVYQRNQTATLHLNEQQYQQTLRDGVTYGLDVPAIETGVLQCRIAVVDRSSGHLGTASQVVEVPDLKKNALVLSGVILSTESAALSANTSLAGGPSESVIALRRFPPGATLVFAYAVYNARRDYSAQRPQLNTQTHVFRDGQLVYTGAIVPLEMGNQPDLQRVTGGGRLRLGAEFPEGEYMLQITVTDVSEKNKPRGATQWIDFEVTK